MIEIENNSYHKKLAHTTYNDVVVPSTKTLMYTYYSDRLWRLVPIYRAI